MTTPTGARWTAGASARRELRHDDDVKLAYSDDVLGGVCVGSTVNAGAGGVAGVAGVACASQSRAEIWRAQAARKRACGRDAHV